MRINLIICLNSFLELISIRLWRIWLKALPHSHHEKETPAMLKGTTYIANYYLWGLCLVEPGFTLLSPGPVLGM